MEPPGRAPTGDRAQLHHERSGAPRAPKVQFPADIYSASALISANLLAIPPLRAYEEAKRAPRTHNFVICFI